MGTTQSKAGTDLIPTQSVCRTPSTDIQRADSVESTSKEPPTASLRHATTKEEAGSRKGQQSSPGNFGLSGADAEEAMTALLKAHLASKGRGLRNPKTLSSRPPYSTPDTPTQKEKRPSQTRPCCVPPATSPPRHDASCPPIPKAQSPDGGDPASKPHPSLLPPHSVRDGPSANREPAAGSRETRQGGNPRTLPADPLSLVAEGFAQRGVALLPRSTVEPRPFDYADVVSHLNPDLAKPERVAKPRKVAYATRHHVVFAITAYEIDTSIQSQTPFDPDHPQALSDLGSITSERKVLMVPPEDPMELPLRSTMMIRAGVFTVAAKDLELDTVSGRFQLLVRALETHRFDIDWSLNVQMSKAADSLVSVWAPDGSVV